MDFKIVIVDYPAKQLVGVKVLTNMKTAIEDCPKAWQNFMPRMTEVCSSPQESFGVSVMLNENDFEYWAAVEMNPQLPMPEGLEMVSIKSGTYACCTVPTIERLGEAYTYIFSTWLQGQSEYVANYEANSFELYQTNWQPSSPFEICMAVKKK
ncbi:MAG: GyrI-like domain-containing protein [Holophagaceae bacterium]|nr:GyrI-like domain-containing protein [Holophagaceae bacterium]